MAHGCFRPLRRAVSANRGTTRRIAARCLLLGVGALLAGCASVDFDYPKVESRALADTQDTNLGRLAAGLEGGAPDESGFYLLSDGIDALAARLILAGRAERSLDVQYYLIADDVTGSLLLRELLRAADRGVRVRLLVDDIQTAGYDRGMWVLDAHPDVEVRVFNPFPTRRWRMFSGALDFRRVNRRMHNKSFSADNQVTVIGGRNVGDEYFAAREDVNFGDLDVIGFGPVVRDVSDMFDLYWNDRLAVPVPALVDAPDDPAGEERAFRARLAAKLEGVEAGPYGKALAATIVEVITRDETDGEVLTWSGYELVYDSPAKAGTKRDENDEGIVSALRQAIEGAGEEFVLISPYFVPRKTGIEGFRRLRERGVEVCVVTNSLAANNHAVVHSGYTPARKPLLKMGVDLWEVRSDAQVAGAERGGVESSRATLHTKAFCVDRRVLFIGSFNFDPRSAFINTEMGILLEDPGLASRVLDNLDSALPEQAYQVVLNEQGKLRWVGWNAGERVEFEKEPDTGFWKRFGVGFMRLFPIQGQL